MSALAACRAPVVQKQLPSAVVDYKVEELDPQLVQDLVGDGEAEQANWKDDTAYRVGPGDTLLVAVYGHPELSIATYGGSVVSAEKSRLSGLVIDNDGTIQFPLIGTVQVAGKTSAELRLFLEEELARYVKEPKVTVQVIFNGSIRYYLLGEFTEPGLKYSDRPLRLLEALSLAGSIRMEKASLRGAYVARGNRRLPVNFRRLVREGDLRQNYKLHSGDVIVVPDNANDRAFVFGALGVRQLSGGPVTFADGHLNIVQALAQVGFGFNERFQSRLSKVRVIRSEGTRGEFYVVNVAKILKGNAALFWLAPGDVVVVPPTAYTTWNLLLGQLLPTLQTVGGVLTPWVQIKYLQNN